MPSPPGPIIRTLPNVLTTLRLLAVPVFGVLMVMERGASLAAGLVFLTAALTDFLDGYLARRFRVMSQYGKILDPIADRLLVNTAVFFLCWYDSSWFGNDGRLNGIEFFIVLARDLPAMYGYARIREVTIPDVSLIGKLGMALMMAGLAWLLLLPDAMWPVWPFQVGLIVSVIAFGMYLRRHARQILDGPQRGTPDPRVD